MRIDFDLNYEHGGVVAYLKSTRDGGSDNDPNSLGVVGSVAQDCAKCPLLEKCQSKIAVVRAGLFEKSVVVAGNRVNDSECLIKANGVESPDTFNNSYEAARRLYSLTDRMQTPKGPYFTPKR